VGGVRRGNEAQRNDLAERNPSRPAAAYSYRLLCEVATFLFTFIFD